MEYLDKKRLYVGIDESNNGKFPTIFVSVLSRLEKDIEEIGGLSKLRKNHKKLFGNIGKRDYSFLQLLKRDNDLIPRKELLGAIVTSLICEDVNKDLEELFLFIDGDVPSSRRTHTKDLISEYLGLNKSGIHLKTGPAFDQKFRIVNLADQIANYIFRNYSSQKIHLNKHEKQLKYDFIRPYL